MNTRVAAFVACLVAFGLWGQAAAEVAQLKFPSLEQLAGSGSDGIYVRSIDAVNEGWSWPLEHDKSASKILAPAQIIQIGVVFK